MKIAARARLPCVALALWTSALVALALAGLAYWLRSEESVVGEWRPTEHWVVRAICERRSIGWYDVQLRVVGQGGEEYARATLFRSLDSRADCWTPRFLVTSVDLDPKQPVLTVDVGDQRIQRPVSLGAFSLEDYRSKRTQPLEDPQERRGAPKVSGSSGDRR